MLQQAMRALGIDLDREIARIIRKAKDQVEALNARTIRELKAYTRELAESAILLAIGAAFGAVAVAVALAALYAFLNERYGTYVGLGAIFAIATVAAIALIAAAQRRAGGERMDDEPVPEPAIAVEEPVIADPPRPRPAVDLAALLPPPPVGAPLTEILIHRVKARGAEAAEEAIDQAEKVVRTGSRPAMVATLALTALVGLYFGRQQRL